MMVIARGVGCRSAAEAVSPVTVFDGASSPKVSGYTKMILINDASGL